MDNIRKQQVKGYILLESLIAMALLAVLSSVVVTEVSVSRAQVVRQNQAIEVLNVGVMAFDSKQTNLHENGVSVTVTRTDKTVVLENAGQEVLRLEILQETPQSFHFTGMSGGAFINQLIDACDSGDDGTGDARV